MKIIRTGSTLLVFLAFTTSSTAQAWIGYNKIQFSAATGATHLYFLPVHSSITLPISSFGLTFNFATENKINRSVGLGVQVGLDIFSGSTYKISDKITVPDPSVGIPAGIKLLYHILEASYAYCGRKLDVYVGFNAGGGPVFERNRKCVVLFMVDR